MAGGAVREGRLPRLGPQGAARRRGDPGRGRGPCPRRGGGGERPVHRGRGVHLSDHRVHRHQDGPGTGPVPADPRLSRPSRLPPSALLGLQRALELVLVHVRAALDAALPRLVVQLVAGRAVGADPVARPLAAAPAGRHVLRGGAAGGLRLAGAGAFLVDGPCGDLLRASLALAPVLRALLDVLVLPFALGAGTGWHDRSFPL
ncbi:hypothetical protein SGPA1_10318 [Streptomyces misionensis JCM 4497]